MHVRDRVLWFLDQEKYTILVTLIACIPSAVVFWIAARDLGLSPFDHGLFHLPIGSLRDVSYTREQMFLGFGWAMTSFPVAIPFITALRSLLESRGAMSSGRRILVMAAVAVMFATPVLDFARSMIAANIDERARLEVLADMQSMAAQSGQIDFMQAVSEQLATLIMRTRSSRPVTGIQKGRIAIRAE